MDPDPSFIAIGVGLCLLVLAFTSAVDTAFTSLGRHRLNALLAEGVPQARTLARLIDDPYRFKAVIILLHTSTTIIATAFTLYLTRHLGVGAQAGYLALLWFAILVVSEALPKALATRNPNAVVLTLSGPFSFIMQVLWPLVTVINLLTRPLVQLIRGKDTPHAPLVTEEELRLLVNVGEEEGLIEHDEREMIEGIFSFGETLAREIMVPRVDIVALDVDTSLDQALELIIDEGHSRIPVYEETVDNIIGILYAKDLLPALRDGRCDTSLQDLVRSSVHFVPETMKVDVLLKEMQLRKVHMAIIVDEYGGTAGLATIEDLIEEIVGEIQDEYDIEEPSIQMISETELLVDARVSIDDINDLTDLHLESTDADRIGGLVYEELGRVPEVGDRVVLDEAVVTVLSVQGVRPEKLRITFDRPSPEEEEEPEPQHSEIRAHTLPGHNEDISHPLFALRQWMSRTDGKEDRWSDVTTRH